MNLIEQISNTFYSQPSNISKIREMLSSRKLNSEELATLAMSFVDNCLGEYQDALNPEIESITTENMHCNHIVEAIELLLEFGLDPNFVVDGDNAMWSAMWIDAPNIAASVMRSQLRNGGNPNLCTAEGRESIFEYINLKISYDENTHEYFHTFQCWLVLMAYGACYEDGDIPITMIGKNTVDIFKDFELFDYEIEYLPPTPGNYGNWIMHIYNVETNTEVATY